MRLGLLTFGGGRIARCSSCESPDALFGIATDAAGNLYVADASNRAIRKGFIPPRFAAFYTTANSGFVFQISGVTNRACQIETSTTAQQLGHLAYCKGI